MEKEVNNQIVETQKEKSFNPTKIITILIFIVIIAIIIQVGFFSYSYFKNNQDILNLSIKNQNLLINDTSKNITNISTETNLSIQNQSVTNTSTINTITSTDCMPKICEDYPGRCGLLNDKCGKTIDCFLSCEQGTYCYIGEAETTNICINNTLICRDVDNGIDYNTLGRITLKGVFTDFCTSSNLTEFYCYYNGVDFEVRNETIECNNGCSEGVCS